MVEVISFLHPVRLFAVPECDPPPMAVVTNRSFKKGMPVLLYSGNVTDTVDNLDSTSTCLCDFDVESLGLSGMTLIVDGAGHIGGYVNGSWTPTHLQKRRPNVEFRSVWLDDYMYPIIVMTAIKNISKGDELIVDYGPHYWRGTWIKLLRDHAEYVVNALDRLSQIKGLMENAGHSFSDFLENLLHKHDDTITDADTDTDTDIIDLT